MANSNETTYSKKQEAALFIFLTVFLAPILSVVVVGIYGFAVWFSQMLMGPPGV